MYRFHHMVYLVILFLVFHSCKTPPPNVQIISSAFEEHSPSFHGMNKIYQMLDSIGAIIEKNEKHNDLKSDYYIIAGVSSEDKQVTQMLGEMKLTLPTESEALLIRKTTYQNKPAILLCGGDEVGLMYAALDIAKRISWSTHPNDLFKYIQDATETPNVKERAVSAGTFQRKYFEQRLHDLHYWEKYFDMMAANRLNQFLLIFGYKNNQMKEPNFMAPAYPNFFNVDEFPYVKMVNVTAEQQQRNIESLRRIIDLAHSRGIEFGVGLWDQIERDKRYLAMVGDAAEVPADFPDDIIWGLSQENLIPYTKIAMRKFFRTFPEIDLVQFRMHWESGISGEVALKFWKEIFNMLKEENPDLKIEARAKDVPDKTLYDGVETGMDFRVTTKHWMEQMGMPFHPTHINKNNQFDRRHGYADLLRYPKRYDFKWRVWSGGTTRLFLWGDPAWVKTFAEGSHLYDAIGFEFNEPLYFKMNGSKHDAAVSELLNPENKYYTYEFERYWHYYQVMGRIGYNPETPTDIWEKEFENRFGKETGTYLMEGLHQASKVLPRIVSASYLYARFPSPQGWPELQRMESLKHFALNSKPSDIQQFASVNEEADQILNGTFSVKRNPTSISKWFADSSQEILLKVQKAEESVGENQSKEFVSTITDLKMLAYLARYHSQRLLAAVQYNLYTKTSDLSSFDKAIEYETKAVEAYGNMVAAAGTVYNKQLDFGSNKKLFPSHWKKEHQQLLSELDELRSERNNISLTGEQQPLFAHVPVQRAGLNGPIIIATTLNAVKGIKTARVFYFSEGKEYQSIALQVSDRGISSVEIPNPGIEGNVNYYFELVHESGKTEYFPTKGAASPYSIILSDDREAPLVEVERITSAKPNTELKVSAKLEAPSVVQQIALRYRRVTQFEDYQSAEMNYNPDTQKYEAAIPAHFFDGKYDVMYFVEVMDTKGNGRMYPDMELEIPYVIVNIER